MKKKILFVIDSLQCAGAEKSLVTLLSLLNYKKYQVDLQLFSYGGAFEEFIPKEVKILPPLEYTLFVSEKKRAPKTKNEFLYLWSRLKYSIKLRLYKKLNITQYRLYWQSISSCYKIQKNNYDIAIAYSQGIPTFYIIDKINANKKIAWINVSYNLKGKNKQYQEPYYKKLDNIVTVSSSVYNIFKQVYPQFSNKLKLIWDINDANLINLLSNKTIPSVFKSSINILTIARLNKEQKGYDITLEACKILKERNINFKWYAIGKGEYREEMEQYIKNNNLKDTFIFLGTMPNPYPYLKSCTLYVQTSRYEGYGLSIAEARILNRPVVTTEFDAVYNQMVPGKNGLVVKQDPVAVADAIENLLRDKDLYDSIVAYQQQEKKGNQEEIEKFYQLVE